MKKKTFSTPTMGPAKVLKMGNLWDLWDITRRIPAETATIAPAGEASSREKPGGRMT